MVATFDTQSLERIAVELHRIADALEQIESHLDPMLVQRRSDKVFEEVFGSKHEQETVDGIVVSEDYEKADGN